MAAKAKRVWIESLDRWLALKPLGFRHVVVMRQMKKNNPGKVPAYVAKSGVPDWKHRTIESIAKDFPLEVLEEIGWKIHGITDTKYNGALHGN